MALEAGHEVMAMDLAQASEKILLLEKQQPNFRYVQGDAQSFDTVINAMRESACEGIINLAAIRNPSDYLVKLHNTNVIISWNVLRAAAEVSVSFRSLAIWLTGEIVEHQSRCSGIFYKHYGSLL